MTLDPRLFQICVAAAAAALAVWQFRHLVRADPDLSIETVLTRCRYLTPATVVVLAAVLILTVLNGVHDLAWKLPIWLQYCGPALKWGLLFGSVSFIFTLGTVSAFHSRHRKRQKILLVTICLLGSLFLVHDRYRAPVAATLQDKVVAGVVLQTGPSSSAAATGANIARRFGIERSERAMAEIFGTTRLGTSAAQILVGMRNLGFECELVKVADIRSVEVPAFLFVDHPATGPGGHVVALMRTDRDSVEIWDPLYGVELLSAEVVRQIWSGHAIVCRHP